MAGKHLAHISIRFGVDLREFSTKMQNASRQIAKTGRKMQSVGAGITRNLTLPIVAAGGAAAKMAIDFDDSMNKIQNLVGVVGEEVDKMREGVLALSGQTAKAPQELADALFVVTSAGKRGAEAMAILESAAKASAVGLGDTTEIARGLVAATTAYGEETLNAQQAADIFFATVRAGNLEAESLAPNLGKVVGFAAQMGVSFAEVGANIAAYTRLGISAEEATTGLTAVLSAFANPTDGARKALAQFGLTAQGVRDSIAQNGLAATLNHLMEVTGGNIEVLAEIIPNIRAFKNILGVAGQQGEQYVQIVDEIKNSNGALAAGFDNVRESAGFAARQALADLQKLGIEIGDKLLPIVVRLAESVSNMVTAFSRLSDGTQNAILKTAGLVAVAGPLLSIFGKLFVTFSRILTPMAKFIGGLGYTIDLSRRGAEAIKLTANSMKILRIATVGVTTAFTVGLAALVAYGVDMARFGSKAKKAKKELEELRKETTFLSDQKLGSFDAKKQKEVLEALKLSGLTKERIAELDKEQLNRAIGLLEGSRKMAEVLGLWTEKHSKVLELLKGQLELVNQLNEATTDTTGVEKQVTYAGQVAENYRKAVEQAYLLAKTKDFDLANTDITLADIGLEFDATDVDPELSGIEAITNKAQDATDSISLMGYGLGSIFEDLGTSLANGAKDFGEVVKKMIQSLLNVASAALLAKGSLTGVGLIGALAGVGLLKGVFSALTSSVPAFASGGIVTGPTLAMVGDNRSGKEAIIPLEKMGQVFGMMGGQNVNVSVQDVLIEGDKLRLVMSKAERNYNRRN